jgi:acylglycerol lipase
MIIEKQTIELENGQKIYTQMIESGSPVWLIVTHGLGEHCGRHEYMFKLFSQYFNVFTYDLRGHGRSEGKKAYAESFDLFTEDLSGILSYLKKTYKMDRFILFGHSMGGLITAKWLQENEKSEVYPEKVYLSSPPVAAPGLLGRVFQYSPQLLSESLTKIPLSTPLGGMLDLKKLSHDPRVYESYINDPNCALKVETKLLFNVVYTSRQVFSKPLRCHAGLYVSIGTKDALVHPKALIEYFERVEKNAKLLKVEGAYHEMHNEIARFKDQYFKFLKDSIMSAIYT